MTSKTIMITLAAVVAVLVAGTAGTFAWDSGRSDVIANGVKVGSVDVGGLSRAEARARLGERLVKPLSTPLVISAAGQAFQLSARETKIAVDVEAMLDEAVRRSRAGGVLARTWRAIRGEGVAARITPDVQYSKQAVQRNVDKLRVTVSRKAVDAKLDIKAQAISIRRARNGRTIDSPKLRSDVQSALVSAAADRTLEVPVKTVRPKVSGADLAAKYPVVLAVDRDNFKLSLFKKLKRVKVYPIALGRAGQETPSGLYKIQNKAVDPAWSVPNAEWAGSLAGTVIPSGAPNNPLKARWLGIYDGVGVHGTDARESIGTNASAGCIRMLIEDVKQLYDDVPVGAPIYIG